MKSGLGTRQRIAALVVGARRERSGMNEPKSVSHVCFCQLNVHLLNRHVVRHPAVTGVYCIVRDSRSGCSNDFKCTTLYVFV